MSRFRPPRLEAPCPHCGGRQPEIFHTSCRMRAAWSPAQRRAFDLADDRRQLREALERCIPLPDPELVAEPRLPARRVLVRNFVDLTGRRFGRLLVLTSVRLEAEGRRTRRAWVVRCDCARTFEMREDVLRRGARQCHSCGVAAANRQGPLRGAARRSAA